MFPYPSSKGASYYLSPEIFRTNPGHGVVLDYSKNDDFALGITFYKLITGKYPFGTVDQSDWKDTDYIPISDH